MIFICVDVVNIHETAFKEISSNFFPSFISLYDCKDIYIWSIVVNNHHSFSNSFFLSFTFLLLFFTPFLFLFLCYFIFVWCFRIRFQVNILGIYVNKLSAELLRAILDLIRWVIFSDIDVHFFLIFSREHVLISHAHNFINVYPCCLRNETIFAGSDVTERSMSDCFDLQALHDQPDITLSAEHFVTYIVEVYHHKYKLVAINFVTALWQNVISEY